jgi:hypothetical protein
MDQIRLPIGDTVAAADVAQLVDGHARARGLDPRATVFTIDRTDALDWPAAMQWIDEAASDGYDRIRYIMYEEGGKLVVDLAAIASLPVVAPALIRWSPEQQRLGLPDLLQTTDPTWLVDEVPVKHEAWSLICEFDRSPAVQGNPSLAAVRYLMPTAPHRLEPGLRLHMFERDTQCFALVEILDSASRPAV